MYDTVIEPQPLDANLTMAFVDRATDFLSRHAHSAGEPQQPKLALFDDGSDEARERALEGARLWQRAKFDAGYAWIAGPTELGGGGHADALADLYQDLEASYDVPDIGPLALGISMVGPAIERWGTEEARRRYLRGLYRGDLVGCQLFSEPGAGSDLANVQMRATPDGDGWVLDGQKVWTSYAHQADVAEVICRTGDGHGGITVFVLDMHVPGIDVRPLRQMTGGSSFNEVFLSNVRVPDGNRLGAVGDGWSVVRWTLAKERAAFGRAGGVDLPPFEFVRRACVDSVTDRPTLAARLAGLYVDVTVARLLKARLMAQSERSPGAELSMNKLWLTHNMQTLAAIASEALGPGLIAGTASEQRQGWAAFVLGVPGMRIGGGTDEIQRNILAERVLGLPRER